LPSSGRHARLRQAAGWSRLTSMFRIQGAVGRHCCWNGEKVSVSLVVDGGSSNAQTPGPKTGDSEGAVVWILLIALWNPSSTSTRGLLPDPEPGLYVNEGVPAGGFWTIPPFYLVERYIPPLS
jgi:hypothetical protein